MNELLLWGIPVVCLLATFLGIALWTKNPAMAMGNAIPLVFLFPAWAKCSTGIEPIDIKSTATIGMLCLYSFLPGATYPWRLVLADYFMLGLLAVHLISDRLRGMVGSLFGRQAMLSADRRCRKDLASRRVHRRIPSGFVHHRIRFAIKSLGMALG
jgi:hypothetical protein